MKKLFIPILIFSFNSIASDSCQNIDNRNSAFYENGVEQMRDQHGSNWCYAYFTADMYSHRLAKTSSGRELLQNQMISPLSFLINPPDKPKINATAENTAFTELTSGGDNPTVLSQRINSRELPLCLESELPSNVLGTREGAGAKDSMHIFTTLQSLDNFLRSTSQSEVDEEVLCASWLGEFSNYFSDMDFSSFRSILAQTQQYGVNSHTGSLLLQAHCSTNLNSEDLQMPLMEQMEFDFNSNDSRQAYITQINTVLERGDILGISYNPDLLGGQSVPEDRRVGHISSIVGKRCVNNQEQYMIRNSYGTDCHIYSMEFQARCENGNIWVTADEIIQMSSSIVYFQE